MSSEDDRFGLQISRNFTVRNVGDWNRKCVKQLNVLLLSGHGDRFALCVCVCVCVFVCGTSNVVQNNLLYFLFIYKIICFLQVPHKQYIRFSRFCFSVKMCLL